MAYYEEIILAAWLHDIGKLVQRAGAEQYCSKDLEGYLGKLQKSNRYSHTHVLYTEGFLQSLKDCFPDKVCPAEVIRLASSHHNPSLYDEWLIAQGDRLSSGSDRCAILQNKGMETATEKPAFYERPLTNVLSTVHLEEQKEGALAYTPLTPLDNATVPAVSEAQVTREGYRELLRLFEQDFRALQGKPYKEFMEALDTLFERYCWCIPASTQDDADISLYQHAKTTAAFAGTLYRYHAGTNTEIIKNLADNEVKKFLFINGDVSGIQPYIFDLKTSADNSKLLRSRSFVIWVLSELIAQKLAAQCGVSAEHIIIAAGADCYCWFRIPAKSRICCLSSGWNWNPTLLKNLPAD